MSNLKLTKEECVNALENFWDGNCNNYWVLKQLINEHFDNNMARTCQNLVSEIDKLEKEVDKLEKALYKAIDEYADLHDSLVANGSDDFPYFNKEEYKECLLNEI